jgi:excisionase family DNA binding protein
MDPTARPGLKIAEAAELMQVSRMTVYRLVWSGALASERVGRLLRVPENAVHAYLRGDAGPGTAAGNTAAGARGAASAP